MKAPINADVEEMARLETAETAPVDKVKPIKTELPSSDDIDDSSSVLSDPPDAAEAEDDAKPPQKKQMTIEEYEAMLDAEDGEGGFLEAGDIAR
jgi:hypothetical protein